MKNLKFTKLSNGTVRMTVSGGRGHIPRGITAGMRPETIKALQKAVDKGSKLNVSNLKAKFGTMNAAEKKFFNAVKNFTKAGKSNASSFKKGATMTFKEGIARKGLSKGAAMASRNNYSYKVRNNSGKTVLKVGGVGGKNKRKMESIQARTARVAENVAARGKAKTTPAKGKKGIISRKKVKK